MYRPIFSHLNNFDTYPEEARRDPGEPEVEEQQIAADTDTLRHPIYGLPPYRQLAAGVSSNFVSPQQI